MKCYLTHSTDRLYNTVSVNQLVSDRLYNTVSVNQLLSDRPADYPATNAKPCVIIEPKTMNEQRTQAYLNLINQLLSCNSGDEPRILQENQELLDQGLIEVMVAVAQQFGEAERENEARWLMNIAQQLAQALGLLDNATTESENTSDEYLNFLMETLQKISENPNPQVIYPFWAQNLDKLDDNLAQILDSWARETLTKVNSKQAYSIAVHIFNFSNLIKQFPLGN
ncbi:MAG: hypothetical protein ACKPIC_08730, partial [Microcystis panniformis]